MVTAGIMFAMKTSAVPPSEMLFADASMMTYAALFSKPRIQKTSGFTGATMVMRDGGSIDKDPYDMHACRH